MRDHTIDEALVELARTMKALKSLRAERKTLLQQGQVSCRAPGSGEWGYFPSAVHAAAKRASLDLTRKLADLRAGR